MIHSTASWQTTWPDRNRKLADDLARQEPQAGLFEMNGHINDKNKESPGNWIRQSLARVKVGSTRPR
jgi:hypothetical protein